MRKNKQLNGNTVYILGLDYRVQNEIPWTEAITHILRGKMTPFEVHPTKRIRTAGDLSFAWPVIARLNYWVQPPKQVAVDLNTRASRSQILRRDARTCAYCGSYANTVDHIIPESWCKKHKEPFSGWTWGNLVAACEACNQYKGDRTPEEAGLKLLWYPRANQNKYLAIQARVDSILKENKEYYDQLDGLDSWEGLLNY